MSDYSNHLERRLYELRDQNVSLAGERNAALAERDAALAKLDTAITSQNHSLVHINGLNCEIRGLKEDLALTLAVIENSGLCE